MRLAATKTHDTLRIMLRPLILALALLPAAAANRPPPADPLTATIHTEDADRFATLFAKTKGKIVLEGF